jgi:hypothetical protein
MATKIKDTPILFGDDAERFLEMVKENLKKDHSKAFERAKKVYYAGFNVEKAATLPNCDVCNQPQTELGALLFSPPDKNNMCKKLHICVDCYATIML